MVKRGKKAKKEPYFDVKEEEALLKYILTDSVSIRHKLYSEILAEPFRQMTEAILRKYGTHIGNYDIHEVEANALSHLVEQMVKYYPYIVQFRKKGSDLKWEKDKNKEWSYYFKEEAEKKLAELLAEESPFEYKIIEPKGFSYCQTIVRNFYRDHGRRSYAEKTNNLSWEDHSTSIMERSEFLYEIDDNDRSDLEVLIDIIVNKLRDRIDVDSTLKKNEIIVGEAIINVLSNWHILFLEETPDGRVNKKVTNKYQKNKILQLLKEQTRLNTKEIRMSMKPFKELYFMEKEMFYYDEN